MATKAEVEAYLAGKYTVQSTALNNDLTGNGANFYDSICLEFGEATDGTIDLAMQRRVTWVVYDEGGAGENAAIYKDVADNAADKSLATATGALIDQYKIANNTTMIQRVSQAAQKSARDIITEDPGTTNHAERLKLAIDVIKNIGEWQTVFSTYVAANATVQSAGGAATDSDLQYVCSTEFPWTSVAVSIYGA